MREQPHEDAESISCVVQIPITEITKRVDRQHLLSYYIAQALASYISLALVSTSKNLNRLGCIKIDDFFGISFSESSG